jgi:hypothetical protein
MGIHELFPVKFFSKKNEEPIEGDFAPVVVRVESNDTAQIEGEEILNDVTPPTPPAKRGPAPD